MASTKFLSKLFGMGSMDRKINTTNLKDLLGLLLVLLLGGAAFGFAGCNEDPPVVSQGKVPDNANICLGSGPSNQAAVTVNSCYNTGEFTCPTMLQKGRFKALPVFGNGSPTFGVAPVGRTFALLWGKGGLLGGAELYVLQAVAGQSNTYMWAAAQPSLVGGYTSALYRSATGPKASLLNSVIAQFSATALSNSPGAIAPRGADLIPAEVKSAEYSSYAVFVIGGPVQTADGAYTYLKTAIGQLDPDNAKNNSKLVILPRYQEKALTDILTRPGDPVKTPVSDGCDADGGTKMLALRLDDSDPFAGGVVAKNSVASPNMMARPREELFQQMALQRGTNRLESDLNTAEDSQTGRIVESALLTTGGQPFPYGPENVTVLFSNELGGVDSQGTVQNTSGNAFLESEGFPTMALIDKNTGNLLMTNPERQWTAGYSTAGGTDFSIDPTTKIYGGDSAGNFMSLPFTAPNGLASVPSGGTDPLVQRVNFDIEKTRQGAVALRLAGANGESVLVDLNIKGADGAILAQRKLNVAAGTDYILSRLPARQDACGGTGDPRVKITVEGGKLPNGQTAYVTTQPGLCEQIWDKPASEFCTSLQVKDFPESIGSCGTPPDASDSLVCISAQDGQCAAAPCNPLDPNDPLEPVAQQTIVDAAAIHPDLANCLTGTDFFTKTRGFFSVFSRMGTYVKQSMNSLGVVFFDDFHYDTCDNLGKPLTTPQAITASDELYPTINANGDLVAYVVGKKLYIHSIAKDLFLKVDDTHEVDTDLAQTFIDEPVGSNGQVLRPQYSIIGNRGDVLMWTDKAKGYLAFTQASSLFPVDGTEQPPLCATDYSKTFTTTTFLTTDGTRPLIFSNIISLANNTWAVTSNYNLADLSAPGNKWLAAGQFKNYVCEASATGVVTCCLAYNTDATCCTAATANNEGNCGNGSPGLPYFKSCRSTNQTQTTLSALVEQAARLNSNPAGNKCSGLPG